MMELHILNKNSGDTLGEFALGDSSEVIIGRDESCDVRINARSISREHCSIEHIEGEMRLRDLDSSGGTFCGGERIDEIRLEDGMEITVGPALLKFFDAGI
ncbi:MAG: FHA domain-containing protein [Phycisphaerales bacterium]|nr:FHA domain-containing protein [Phycisphaerales bacterium]